MTRPRRPRPGAARPRAGGPRARTAAPRGPDGAEGGDARALVELRRKYRELCEKYETLVARASADLSERIGTVALALSAMRSSPSALALADAGRVLFANPRWTELARTAAPLARAAGAEALPVAATVRQIAEAGTAAVLAPDGPEIVAARYVAERGGGGWDLRFERTRYAGRAVAMIVATDATRALREERELEDARRGMAEQERLRTVGLLAAGVAHDFTNALSGAAMHLKLLAGDALPDPARRRVEALQRIVGGMAERTRRLRELALQRHELAIERVELGAIVGAAVDLAAAEFRARASAPVEIEVDPGVESLPPVRGAGAELVHVVLNLLLNARDAMPRGGAVRVRGASEPDVVVLEVADEGPGIAPEHLARVFEPFFTTKAAGGGTGLGLATAYGLMRALEGEIGAANSPGGGAVFALRFRRWAG